MTSIAARLALVLAPLGLMACEPAYGDPWGDAYGAYPAGIYGDRYGYDGYSDSYIDPYYGRETYDRQTYRADGRVFRTAAERDAYLRRVRNAEQDAYLRGVRQAEARAEREAALRRQERQERRANHRQERLERELQAAERERRRAERLDRRPVRTDRDDRRDRDRRQAAFDEQRAREAAERNAADAERERRRLERLARIADRRDRANLDNSQQRPRVVLDRLDAAR